MKVWVLDVLGPVFKRVREEEVRNRFSQYGEIVGVHKWYGKQRKEHHFIEFASLPDVKLLKRTFKDTQIEDLSLACQVSYHNRFKSLSSNTLALSEPKKRKASIDWAPMDENSPAGTVAVGSSHRPQKRAKRDNILELSENFSRKTPPPNQDFPMTSISAVPLQSIWTPQRNITNGASRLENDLTSMEHSSTQGFGQACVGFLPDTIRRPLKVCSIRLAASAISGDEYLGSVPLASHTQPNLTLLRKATESSSTPQQTRICRTSTTPQARSLWKPISQSDSRDSPSQAEDKRKSLLGSQKELLTAGNISTEASLEEERKKHQGLQENITALNKQLNQSQDEIRNMSLQVLKEAKKRRVAELELKQVRKIWKIQQEKTRQLLSELLRLAHTGDQGETPSVSGKLAAVRIKLEPLS